MNGNSSNRVVRGGSWGSDAQYLRPANRSSVGPSFRDFFIGFRLVRTKITLDSFTLLSLEDKQKKALSVAVKALREIESILK